MKLRLKRVKLKYMLKVIIILIVLVLIVGGIGLYIWQRPDSPQLESKLNGNMKLTSSAFENNQTIPSKYTCDGEDINPPLEIQEIPETAQSLVLIVDDPDAPMGTWAHWLVWNIDPSIVSIKENSIPEGAVQGQNSFGKQDYGGPCPPSGTHHYYFKVYALDIKLELDSSSDKKDLESVIQNYILDQAELIGLYQR